jgi:hypothetical protein
MKQGNSQNERLDRVGRDLLEASKMRDDEIENIINAPHLFRSVRGRIESERSHHKKNIFRIWEGFPEWGWRLPIIASGLIMVFIAAAVGLSVLKNAPVPSPVAKVPVRTVPDQVVTHDPKPYTPSEDERPMPVKVENLVQRAVVRNSEKPREKPVKFEEVTEFYRLTFTEDPVKDSDGGQIIRVELPRSSLLALGVDVPSTWEPRRSKAIYS